mmetsp:Transcript_11554/g.35732  ORF Transcript_11554/g.35732 Transcript_11554/m.35732 type:complete len:112 (-) Transcript_11554:2277-2612(-)
MPGSMDFATGKDAVARGLRDEEAAAVGSGDAAVSVVVAAKPAVGDVGDEGNSSNHRAALSRIEHRNAARNSLVRGTNGLSGRSATSLVLARRAFGQKPNHGRAGNNRNGLG